MHLAHLVGVVVFVLFVAAPFAPKQADATSAGPVPELSTRTSTTDRNRDGSLTTHLYAGSVNYRAGGGWQPIDDTLVPDSGDYAVENKANRFHAHFKNTLDDNYLKVDVDGQSYFLSAVGAARAALSAHGASAQYGNAFDKVDLSYDVLADSVKETLVLHDASVPTHYRFFLSTTSDAGVEVAPNGDGSFAVTGTGRDIPAFTIAAPVVTDAAGAVATVGQGVSLDVKKTGDRWAIDLAIDNQWLHDNARVFPVSLDPTLTIQPPLQSASWKQSSSTNPGVTGARLSIGADSATAWRAGTLFDLGDIPVGANISDAELKLYYDGTCLGTCPTSGSMRFDAQKMSGFWTTGTTTGNVATDPTTLGSVTLAAGAAPQWLSWNVTSTVDNWRLLQDTNYGFLVKSGNEALSSGGISVPSGSYTDTTVRPRLDVTYVDDGLELQPPSTLHSNGADLLWTPYADPNGAAFDRYDIYRSQGAGDFTPSASTLIATIKDPSVTTYSDTTAAPNATFTYKIVANGTASSTYRTVTLPADGHATKTLSTATAEGRATYLVYNNKATACGNYGSVAYLKIGTDATYIRRPVLKFDLRDIPATATVTDAQLSLFQSTAVPSGLTTTVSLHRISSDWREGTSGNGGCTGDGATWYETYGGVKWATAGGDFDSSNAATPFALTSGALPTWQTFGIPSLVQNWVNGTQPNLGVLLKLDDETQANGRNFNYESDDYTAEPTLRPKLTVTYTDGSHALLPTASVASPAQNDTVSGTVALAAAAADDGRVARVDFRIDGATVGSATSAPYTVNWNSASVGAGSHQVTVTATDDAGNTTTSPATTFNVDNSAAPTTSVTSVSLAYAPEVSVDRPAGYWRLGEAPGATVASDASGNGNDGTYEGPALGTAGAISGDSDTAITLSPSGAAAPAVPSFAGTDAFASATTLAGNGGTVAGTNTGASKESGEPNHAGNAGGHSMWWKWTAPVSGTATVNTAISNFDTLLGVYTGTAVNGLTTIASNDDVSANDRTSRVSFSAVAGTTYRFAVDGYGGATGSIDLTWSIAGAPTNNAFASAQALSGGSGGTTGSNVAATAEAGEPSNANVAGGASVWFNWTAPATAPVTIDTIGSQYDTTLGVYTGTAVSALSTVAGDDDSGGNLTSSVTFNATAGTVYRISVDGYSAATGEYSLRWAQNVAPDVALGDRFDFAGTTSFSVEAWVNPSTIDGTIRRIVSKEADDANGHQGWALTLGTSGLAFSRYLNGLADIVSYSTGLPANKWSHVVASYDATAGTLVLYVNGAQVAAAAGASKSLIDNTSQARIGRNAATGGDAFAGSIDEVAVYSAALPAARVQAHSDAGAGKAPASVHGTATITAAAADDKGVSKVEFYVGNDLVGTDTTAPYTATWNTLDPAQPTYNGAQTITTKAYDAAGQVTTSAAFNTTVDNTGAVSQYHATYSSTAVPQAVTYDPSVTTQDQSGVDVTLTNTSSATWSAANVALRYRWLNSDGTLVAEGPDTALPADVPANGTATVRMLVTPPTLPDGVDRAEYTLRFDLRDKPSNSFFAAKGVQPFDNAVIVNKALVRDALGLERYYHYTGQNVGAGMQQLTNIANGNSILRWTPFDEPGRGIATVLDLTYNALEKSSQGPVGSNWSLSISSLTRFGEPLDIHPQKADQICGRSNKYVDFTDGDGTTHRFTDTNSDGYWEAPAGVHLYLRATGSADASKYWALTRPDRVTFYYDQNGYPTSVVDANGNAITFTESSIAPGDDPGPIKQHITKVTDAAGRSFDIAYYTKADAKKPQIRGKVKQITDHMGRALVFTYYEDGNLLRITQKGGTNPDGSALADRSFVFTYTTSDGSGPAIADAVTRANPPAKIGNESTRIYSVRDPRGNETLFSYLGQGNGTDRWKLASLTDRAGKTTSFAYDTVNRVTTVTAPLSRVSKYAYDVEGKVTQITNPLNQVTTVAWSSDRAVSKVTEPSGASTSYTYNDNGYLTSQTDQLGNATQLAYTNSAVDGNDVSSKWEAGRAIPHISDLASKTDPKGVATTTVAGDYQWTFGVDGKGNVTGVTDPLGHTTTNAYNADGTLASTTDANAHTTTYPTYDANGFATAVVDPLGDKTTMTFDAAGELLSTQDPLHQQYTTGDPRTYQSFFDYDPFGRLVRQTAPKSTSLDPGNLIWSSVSYDPNDNVVAQTTPHYALNTSGGAGGDVSTMTYDAMDRVTTQVVPHDPSSTDAAQKSSTTTFAYDAAGRLTSQTDPKGVLTTNTDKDFASFYDYDSLDRVIAQTRYQVDANGTVTQTQRAHVCFDLAGDVRSVTAPNGDAAFPGCPAATTPYTALSGNYTTSYAYDAAHEVTSTTDPLGRTSSVSYDANGATDSYTDESGTKATRSYDQAGRVVNETTPLRTGRDLVTQYEYDAVGNVKRVISPRAYDASSDKKTFTDYVTSYEYDAGDRLTRELQPTSATDTQQLYVHHAYDADGRQLWTSLATDQADPTQVAAYEKSTFTYFDTGSVQKTKDPAEPAVTYDWTAQGQQAARTRGTDGTESWTYFADGQLKQAVDPDGSPTKYGYDANGNVATVDATTGVQTPDQSTLSVQQTYDGFDQLMKTRQQKLGQPWHFTTYAYDLNGAVKSEQYDGVENADGTTTAGRSTDYTYDGAGQVTDQVDHGLQSSCTDDQRIQYTYYATGDSQDEIVSRAGSGCTASVPGWAVRQQTTNTYNLDGSTATTKTWNGPSASATLVQSHSLSYETAAGAYLNGNVASDTFTLASPASTAPCQPGSACTATYTYDAKDRLVSSTDGHGGTSSFTLLPNSMIKQDVTNGTTTNYTYNAPNGVQLNSQATTASGTTLTQRMYYTHGDLTCVTQDDATTQSSAADCPDPKGSTISPRLVQTYAYDDLDRLKGSHTYGTGTETDSGQWSYDALDRVTSEHETHTTGSIDRTQALDYIGLSGDVAKETWTGSGATTKGYSYDAFGSKVGLTDSASGKDLLYGYNAHGDVSQLIDASTGKASYTYGYTAYGKNEQAGPNSLSQGDTDSKSPLNPYQFNSMRYDSGAGALNMGARFYGPQYGSFLQEDYYRDALGDVGLASDPLTGTRYGFTGGNPINFVEVDGHSFDLRCPLNSIFHECDNTPAGALSRKILEKNSAVWNAFVRTFDPEACRGTVDCILAWGMFVDGPETEGASPLARFLVRALDRLAPRVATRALERAGVIAWVSERSSQGAAREYELGAAGARGTLVDVAHEAPSIRYIRNGKIARVRFDGLRGATLIDRKLAVVMSAKAKNQALRQSEALFQNGLKGLWEVPTKAEARRARRLFEQLGIKNIAVKVVPR